MNNDLFPIKFAEFDLEGEEVLSIVLLHDGEVRWRTKLSPDKFEEKLKMWLILYATQDEDE